MLINLWCVNFHSMFDVGGQRIERRKWIQCFNGDNIVIVISVINPMVVRGIEHIYILYYILLVHVTS